MPPHRLCRPRAGDRYGPSLPVERPAGPPAATGSRRGWVALARQVTGTAVGDTCCWRAVVISYYYGVARVAGDFLTSAFTGTAMLIGVAMPLFGGRLMADRTAPPTRQRHRR